MSHLENFAERRLGLQYEQTFGLIVREHRWLQKSILPLQTRLYILRFGTQAAPNEIFESAEKAKNFRSGRDPPLKAGFHIVCALKSRRRLMFCDETRKIELRMQWNALWIQVESQESTEQDVCHIS